MKATGIVRRLDDLGRVVLPKELRTILNLTEGKDSLEIFVEDDSIIFKKYNPGCIFCGNINDLGIFQGKHICVDCAEKIVVKLRQGGE